MTAGRQAKTAKPEPGAGTHKKATFTLPPDAIRAVDQNWRFHETLDAGLSDSKSQYVADLIRRDAAKKNRR
jgi:hypothetical protein